ncbi:MAG TPA: hypothetical protein VGF86_14410 [Candidatus Tumulicola sp.]
MMVSYPGGQVIGSLPTNGEYAFVCSDPHTGNVFLTQYDKILEYVHGGMQPIATLYPPSKYSQLYGCSIDPTTGNLAVAAVGLKHKNAALLVFTEGGGSAVPYTAQNVTYYADAAYDNAGNLFAAADSKKAGQSPLVELPAGRDKIVSITLNQTLQSSIDKLQWDGVYLSMLVHLSYGEICQVQLNGTSGTIVGTTHLNKSAESNTYWIQDGVVLAVYAKQKAHHNQAIAVWPYPAGGDPTAEYFGITKGARDYDISDITVSSPPSF